MLTLLLIGMLKLTFNILQPARAELEEITVPDDYPTIQEAINAAISGDTIYVKAGIYKESIVINKSISLIGESRETTIIDGNGSGWVVNIECSYITFRNFTVRNAIVGIEISETSLQDRIEDNVVRDCYEGIRIISSLWIQENHLLRNNIISDNKYGIVLWGCRNVTILQNNIINNTERGIELTGHPRQPAELKGSHNNLICRNNIIGNKVGIYLLGENNKFYHNNFLNNSENVQVYYVPYYENDWDNGYPSGGNYWDNYTRVDIYSGPYQNIAGSDGIGDEPYTLDVNNRDNYPLMGIFYDFEVKWDDDKFHIEVVSNATISNLQVGIMLDHLPPYIPVGQLFIRFFAEDTINAAKFCRVTIPRVILNGTYTVLIDLEEASVHEIPNSNSTHAYLYFTYQHSKQEHEIIIVPEFPSSMIPSLLLLMFLTMLILILKKPRISKKS